VTLPSARTANAIVTQVNKLMESECPWKH